MNYSRCVLSNSALFLCDAPPEKAKHVTRINADGIMFSDTGIDGPFRYFPAEIAVDGKRSL